MNLTGYAQVLEEITTDTANPQLLTPQVTRVYAYGHELISQLFFNPSTQTPSAISYFGYDGHGNTRLLTDHNGSVSDTYDYDAFGNLIARTGSIANNYLFTGEQFDADLGLYFLRARYQNTQTGRFWTMDDWEELRNDPQALHKYLYAHDDPINGIDPTGHFFLFEWLGTTFLHQVNLRAKDAQSLQKARRIAGKLCHISAILAKPLNMAYNQLSRLLAGTGFQAHHVAQHAPMRDKAAARSPHRQPVVPNHHSCRQPTTGTVGPR